MKRRSFLTSLGCGVVTARALASAAVAQTPMAAGIPEQDYDALNLDENPVGGHLMRPEKEVLFTDYRHIEIGDLAWFAPDGKVLPVAGPPGDPVKAHAVNGMVPYGVRLQAMKPEMDHSSPGGPPGTVSYHEGTYRVWNMETHYPPGADLGSYSTTKPNFITITFYESSNGVDWQEKGKQSIPIKHGTGFDGAYFFLDAHGKPDERFKGVFHASMAGDADMSSELWKRYSRIHPVYRDPRIDKKKANAMFGLTSPDGVHWKLIEQPLMVHYGDTRNTVYYDEWLGKYVLYTRMYWFRRRLVARATSEDFHTWSPAEPVIWPQLDDPLSFDIYTNGRTSYPGLPSYHLMFPTFYRRLDQTAEVHMYSSHNGIMWNRLPGGPILSAGDFDGRHVEYFNVSGDLLPWNGNRLALWFSGDSHPHKYPRWPGVQEGTSGWMTWPKGRLSAVVADEQGQFYTFSTPVLGRRLKLNARVWRAGEIRVGIAHPGGPGALGDVAVDEKDRSVELCDPIFGDSDSHTVSWKGEVDISQQDSSIYLHFRMRRAELFGFDWA